MIINYPTGSYVTVLPQDPDESTSVVYTVSDTDPPRLPLNTSQIPTGIEARARSPRTMSDAVRRANLGELIFTIKNNQPADTVVGGQLFYVGEVLEFTNETTNSVGTINSAIETQHDLLRVGPENIGLNNDELLNIEANAVAVQTQTLLELEGLQKRKDDLEVDIISQQKIINEANRVISGLDIILDKDPGNIGIQNAKAQVEQSKNTAQETIDNDIVELNTLPDSIRAKHDELRSLATLIT